MRRPWSRRRSGRRSTHDLDVDVCVIGAGLAGLTVAREVARRGWSVAVLEAQRVAGGASGRNGGFVSPGFAERIDAIVERVGLPRAKELWALSDAGVEYMRRAIAETEMPGVSRATAASRCAASTTRQALIEHAAMLRVDFGADVEAWPTDQVREVLRSPHYFQALHFPKAFHIHPLNYALGLAAAAEKHGARIFEDTPALALDPAGVRKRVQTPHGMVRARHVVLAGSDRHRRGRCADRRDRAADLDLRGGDGAARRTAVRGGALHRRGRRYAPRRRLLSHRRRRPADVGRAHLDARSRRRGGSRPRCATTS